MKLTDTNKKIRRIAYTGLLIAVAMILSYVESLFPPLISAIPGIKAGLANIAVIFTLYLFGIREAALVSLIRVILMALLFGNVMSLAYSLAGAALSLFTMWLLKRIDRFSAVGISVAGGVAHNAGQILMAMLLLDTAELAYYMVVLAMSGTVAGIFVGLCAYLAIKQLGRFKID